MTKDLAKLKTLMAALLLSSILSGTAAAQEIAFAFTDTLSRSTGLDGLARTKMLVNSLKRVDVPQSMFLIRTATINKNTIDRLAFYSEMKQLLVNAGDNQSPLSRKSGHYMQMDIAKADRILSQHSQYHRHIYFPYLYEGGDGDILSGLQQYLAEHNYQPSYSNYQIQDDYLDRLYQAQLTAGNTIDLQSLQQAYVNLIVDEISAYTAQALVLLGYYPRQVILLHETDLTAYSMVRLVDALREKGFRIISPEKIFSDPIANPFYLAGYSATGYMQAITGLAEPKRNNPYLPSATDKEKIHRYLTAHGLANLADHRED